MKSSNLLLWPLLFSASLSVWAENAEVSRITESEALTIVATREAAKEAKHQALLQELGAAEIVDSKVVQSNYGSLTVNAVKPLVINKPVAQSNPEPQIELNEAEWAAMIASQHTKIPEQISMGANVYGDEYSEITWRDRETNSEFIVWTNVSLNYLRPIISVEDDDYDYMYFGFITNYTREGEAERLQFAQDRGFDNVESRWKTPPVEFSTDQFEYVVIADASTQVPEKLYRQLNAVFGYYVANQEKLEVDHLNSVTLENARRKFLEENPPAPKQTMINFWKIEDNSAAE